MPSLSMNFSGRVYTIVWYGVRLICVAALGTWYDTTEGVHEPASAYYETNWDGPKGQDSMHNRVWIGA